jgi:hypothetical protein
MAENDTIDMATTWPWNAPECEEKWLFNFWDAQRTDIYSFGALCLWILFNEDFRSEDSDDFNYNWIEQLRKSQTTKSSALAQVEKIPNLAPEHMRGLQRFFEMSMAEEPENRKLYLEGLFYQSGGKNHADGPNFIEMPTEFYTPIEQPYAALFQVMSREIRADIESC